MTQLTENTATFPISETKKSNLKEGRTKRAILDDNGSTLGFIIKWNDGSSDLIRAKDLADISVFFRGELTLSQRATDIS